MSLLAPKDSSFRDFDSSSLQLGSLLDSVHLFLPEKKNLVMLSEILAFFSIVFGELCVYVCVCVSMSVCVSVGVCLCVCVCVIIVQTRLNFTHT